jgi:hypothetical protein
MPYHVFSDEQLKTNVTPLSAPLEKVAALRGVYYSWINASSSQPADGGDDKLHVGFIAQEVRAVLPEVTSEIDSSGHLGVRYDDLVPLLIEAVNELNRRTDMGSSLDDIDGYDDIYEDEEVDCECKEEMLVEIALMQGQLDKLRADEARLTALVEQAEERRRNR